MIKLNIVIEYILIMNAERKYIKEKSILGQPEALRSVQEPNLMAKGSGRRRKRLGGKSVR
jgi:hypothetical protein